MKQAHFIILILIGLFFHNCEKKIDPEILATVGESVITAYDFIEAYSNKLINTKVLDSSFERKRTIDELIRTKLFSQAARSQDLSIDSVGMSRVLLAKELALREELYDQIIERENLVIQDSIARKHFKWQNTEISLKHIYHQEKGALDTILPLIMNDVSQFEMYAKKMFEDKELKESGGYLGWVSYNTLDPNLEQIAFSMPVDVVVGPIRSSYGWHLLLKKDERKQMIISEEDYQNSRLGLMNLISKKQSQIIANDYVNGLMDDGIDIDDELVIKTLRKIHAIVFQKSTGDHIIKPKISEKLTEFMIDLKLGSNATLATFKTGSFTINDLISNLRNSSPKTFLDNPIQAFYLALRNKILTDEAIDRGLINNKKVQWKIRSKEDQYLAREFLLSISTKRGNANFSERDILDITKELKTKYPIEVYNENLDEIFLSHNYQTDW